MNSIEQRVDNLCEEIEALNLWHPEYLHAFRVVLKREPEELADWENCIHGTQPDTKYEGREIMDVYNAIYNRLDV